MSDYIDKLREKVGHATILVPHSVVVLFNNEGKVLVEIRSDDGNYDFPGGEVEMEESFEEAAIRECFEECGVRPIDIKLFKVYKGKITHYVYRNGDEIDGIDFVFISHKYEGKLSPQKEEVKKLLFMNLDEIPKDKLSPRNKQIILDLKAQYLK